MALRLESSLEQQLISFAQTLVDQTRAQTIVWPQHRAAGFWFGGGNMTLGPDGHLYLTGRYRNSGDSRLGLVAGERGLELAIFRSTNHGQSFEKILSFSKMALSQPGRQVLSIEGSCLHWTEHEVELYVSSEKAGIPYPPGLESYLKPGCGVWTIEVLTASTIEKLGEAPPVTVFQSDDPEYLHCKDPQCYASSSGDRMIFCTHPFNWSSSNTAFAPRQPHQRTFGPPQLNRFPRGTTWDVAITRATCALDVPRTGKFRNLGVTLLFYDGGESLRNLEEHTASVRRPRGYSCEELGGLAYFLNDDDAQIHRLSRIGPLFVSPYGTGCSRYVNVLATNDEFLATWQQSQSDYSQPLVVNRISRAAAIALLE